MNSDLIVHWFIYAGFVQKKVEHVLFSSEDEEKNN